MSNHFGPEGCAKPEERCEALVKGTGNERYFAWTRHDRQCSKKATSTRKGFAVCHIHNKTDTVEKFNAQ